MKTILISRRSDEGKRLRLLMLKSGGGDHLPHKFKQWEIINTPTSPAITTLAHKDIPVITIYQL